MESSTEPTSRGVASQLSFLSKICRRESRAAFVPDTRKKVGLFWSGFLPLFFFYLQSRYCCLLWYAFSVDFLERGAREKDSCA